MQVQGVSYLSNKCVVWHHHGYGSEESFQVVRELCSSSVAWVHGDERGACVHKFDLAALKSESWQLNNMQS